MGNCNQRVKLWVDAAHPLQSAAAFGGATELQFPRQVDAGPQSQAGGRPGQAPRAQQGQVGTQLVRNQYRSGAHPAQVDRQGRYAPQGMGAAQSN
ncbi:MAG: hypothetical protein ABFR19_00120 [Pseudomonadota bacterium]